MSLTWAPSLKHSDGAWVGVIFFFFSLAETQTVPVQQLAGVLPNLPDAAQTSPCTAPSWGGAASSASATPRAAEPHMELNEPSEASGAQLDAKAAV